MKILAVIPARGGSKRVPGKNIRYLGGKPLICWTIESVKGIPEVTDILVSTDDEKIAEVARTAGTSVPWLRPRPLATDTSKAIDVVLYEINRYEKEFHKIDGVLFLQPTSPFRKIETIRTGIEFYRNSIY